MLPTGDVEDLGGLDEIPEDECWKLLASQPVGRLAMIVGHYPVVLPVNHGVISGGIVFRTGPGTKLWSITRNNVSFEVDCIDPEWRTGWSVLVKGSAHELSAGRVDSRLLSLAAGKTPTPWVPGLKDHLVRIVADSITGRRIRAAAYADALNKEEADVPMP